jgi:hypothetical protein
MPDSCHPPTAVRGHLQSVESVLDSGRWMAQPAGHGRGLLLEHSTLKPQGESLDDSQMRLSAQRGPSSSATSMAMLSPTVTT